MDSGYVTDSLDMSRMLLPFRWPSVQSMGELIPELPHVEVSVHRVKSRMRFKVGKRFSRLAASATLPLSCCFFCTCGGKIENRWKTVPSFPKSTCRYFISAVCRPLHSLVLSRLQHVEVCCKHAIKNLCSGFTLAKGYSANLRSIDTS